MERGLARRPGQRTSTEQVDVDVEDGLSGAGPNVEDGAVSLLDFSQAGNVGGGEVAAADEFGVGSLGFLQTREMSPRNDQHMRRRLRADVFESEHMLVLIDFPGGDFTAEDAAEEAAGSGVSHKKRVSSRSRPQKRR